MNPTHSVSDQSNYSKDLPSLDEILACPVDGRPLRKEGAEWVSQSGIRYPTVHGIPVLFRPNSDNTLQAMDSSRSASVHRDSESDPWHIDTLGLNEAEKNALLEALRRGDDKVDPVVAHMIAATCGNLYVELIGKLRRYPIPDFRLKNGSSKILVDLGCNWGRWCIAAAKQGFLPIGIDPQLGAVLAAKRVAAQLGIKAHFICADARHLPLREGIADTVFSYSVLQHLAREDVAIAAASSRRILKDDGQFFVQMPNVMGPRCFYQWARRGFNDGVGFNVRYWTLSELRKMFGTIGVVDFEIDGFFGIGLQPSDSDLMPPKYRGLLSVSETLRKLEAIVPGLAWAADSVYVTTRKAA